MHKNLKIALLTIGGIALSAIAVTGFILATFNHEDYRKSIIFLVDRLTDYQIEISEPFNCEISITPELTASRLKLFRPDTTDPLEFQNLKIRLVPATLLHGQLQLTTSGRIDEPETLKWLLPKALLALESVKFSTEIIADSTSLELRNLVVDGDNSRGLSLKITGDGLIEDFSAEQPFTRLDLAIKVDAAESSSLQGYLPDKLPEMGPVQGGLRLIAISPSALAAKDIKLDFGRKNEVYLQSSGQINHIPIAPDIVNTGIDFHLILHSATTTALAKCLNSSLPEVGPIRLTADFNGNQKKFSLKNFSGTFGKSSLTADLEASFLEKLPRITGKITIPALFPDDFRKTQTATPPSNAERSTKNKLPDDKTPDSAQLFSRQPLPLNWLNPFNCDIQLNIHSIAGLQKNLRDLELTVKTDDGRLQIDPATLIFEGGQAEISFFLDGTGSIPGMKLECTVDDLDLTGLLTSLDVDSPVTGTVTLHTQLSSQGLSLHDLATNLNGDFGIILEKGVIPNHILKLVAIDVLGWSFSQTIMRDKYADINCCILSLAINHGVVTTQAFIFDSKNLTITGNGTIDLATETYDLTILPKKKRKFWATVTPVTITGPLQDPQVIAIPVKKAALLYGGVLLAPQFFLPAIGINYLWDMVSKDGDRDKNPCLEYLHQQSRTRPQAEPEKQSNPPQPISQH